MTVDAGVRERAQMALARLDRVQRNRQSLLQQAAALSVPNTEEAFNAWVSSPAFMHGHRSAAERAGGDAPRPVGVHSEVWSYEVAGGSGGGAAGS